MCSMCSISDVTLDYFVAILFYNCTSLQVLYCVFINLSLMLCCCLISNTAWKHATPIVSFTCISIDYSGSPSPEDWRQVEDLFDRIINCGESGGHTDSDA